MQQQLSKNGYFYIPAASINFKESTLNSKDCKGILIDNDHKVNLSKPTTESQIVIVLFANRKRYQLKRLTVTESNLIFNSITNNGDSCRLDKKDILDIAYYSGTMNNVKREKLTRSQKAGIKKQMKEQFNLSVRL